MSRWIFLRGLSREAAHWGHFPETFRGLVGGAEILCLDLPGNGIHHAQRSPLTVAALVDDVRRLATARGVEPPYSVLGLSLGGMVAAQWAATYPREVREAVLLNTSCRPFGSWHQRLRPGAIPITLAILLASRSVGLRERLIWRLTSNRRPDPAVLGSWLACARAHPVATPNILRQLVAAARCRLPATPPPVPILTLTSRRDRMVDRHCSHALARAWQTALAEHPSAGHDLPLDDPEWVARQVRDWRARRGGA